MKDNWIINKLKWMLIFGTILWGSIVFASCSALRNYTPSDGVVYNGGSLLIVRSNGHQVVIKK
jgi:hypothetical protein